MIAWTDSARKMWAVYHDQTRAALAGSGADPQEVLEDLKRHVDAEAVTLKLGVVTEDDLRRILAKFGPAGGSALNAADARPAKETVPSPADHLGKFAAASLFFFSILLPVITIVFEWVTGISADCLFDPMPTWFHIVLVALVPVGNAYLWTAILRRQVKARRWPGWLAGLVMGVCIYYSVLYIFFLPFAFIGLAYFGLGLIPLTPYVALLASAILHFRYGASAKGRKLHGYLPGLAIALVCLLSLQLPESLTYYGLTRARAEDKATRDYGISVLRGCGNRSVMLRACYGWLQYREIFNPLNVLATGADHDLISADLAREIYYRVTGRAFNSVPPPTFYTRAGRWNDLNDYVWDDALGGEQVAGRVKGLSLLSSRLDTTTEPNASLGYCEWTMEFKNESAVQREARTEIELPPGAVVSRVTLWINGEEREAAFGGRSQTRAAYQEEAIQHRRDPLLVTTCGPDRVLVQCFPILPNGGTMKIRLGITAPLVLNSLASGNFVWPYFLERNFSISPEFKHSLWLEQPGADNVMVGTHESLAETNLSAGQHATLIRRPADLKTVWAPAETNGQFVWQTIAPLKAQVPRRIVVVVDGSAGMKSYAAQIVAALAQIPETAEAAVMIAADDTAPVGTELLPATPAHKAVLQKQVRRARFTGGQDNLPALEAAWDLADASDDGAVVWVHLPAAVLLSSETGLDQRLERKRKPARLYEIQLGSGPDRLVEKLDALPGIEHVTSLAPGQNGFDRLLGIWSGAIGAYAFDRQVTNDAAGLAATGRVSKHILRLWARDEALRLAGAHQTAAAASLAAKSQLVTPLTGAVVLETQAQYDRHNLSPADPSTVPQIPEPGSLMTLALLLAVLALWQRRRKQKSRWR